MSRKRGGRPVRGRPADSTTSALSVQRRLLRAVHPESRGTQLARYGRAVAALRRAQVDVVRIAVEGDQEQTPAAEVIELLRATWHRQVDDLLDEQALRHPSPRRLILRMPRYADLYRQDRARRQATGPDQESGAAA